MYVTSNRIYSFRTFSKPCRNFCNDIKWSFPNFLSREIQGKWKKGKAWNSCGICFAMMKFGRASLSYELRRYFQ